MAVPTPTTDPLWAYNTPGWNNQGYTGDVEKTGTPSPGGMTPGWLAAPPAVPATTVAAVNDNGLTAQVTMTASGVTGTTVTVTDAAGTAKTVGTNAGTQYASWLVPAGGSIALTYSAGTPTWEWLLINP